jgi:hypothetical protein
MPQIQKQFVLDVSPERFLNACSAEELMEVEILITSPRFVAKMNQAQKEINEENEEQSALTKP